MKRNKPCVLIIDDQKVIRSLVVHILEDFEVEVCDNGFLGLQKMKMGLVPDLIILEISVSSYGLPFLETIRSSGFYKELPVIVLSQEDKSEISCKCRDLQIQGIHSKPFNPDLLKLNIQTALKSKYTFEPHANLKRNRIAI